jgi:hypothetical protein
VRLRTTTIYHTRKQLTEKEQKMVKIEHNLKFVTEVDETHPVGMRLMQLSEIDQVQLLESMLKELLAPMIQPALDEINERGTYAILKVAD